MQSPASRANEFPVVKLTFPCGLRNPVVNAAHAASSAFQCVSKQCDPFSH